MHEEGHRRSRDVRKATDAFRQLQPTVYILRLGGAIASPHLCELQLRKSKLASFVDDPLQIRLPEVVSVAQMQRSVLVAVAIEEERVGLH